MDSIEEEAASCLSPHLSPLAKDSSLRDFNLRDRGNYIPWDFSINSTGKTKGFWSSTTEAEVYKETPSELALLAANFDNFDDFLVFSLLVNVSEDPTLYLEAINSSDSSN
jgi:hypothetical protein